MSVHLRDGTAKGLRLLHTQCAHRSRICGQKPERHTRWHAANRPHQMRTYWERVGITFNKHCKDALPVEAASSCLAPPHASLSPISCIQRATSCMIRSLREPQSEPCTLYLANQYLQGAQRPGAPASATLQRTCLAPPHASVNPMHIAKQYLHGAQRQGAPAAADLQHVVARRHTRLGQQRIHLAQLRLLQRVTCCRTYTARSLPC